MSDPALTPSHLEAPDELPARGFVFGAILKVGLGLVVGLLAADRLVGALDTDRDERTPGQVQFDAELGWTNRPGFTWNKPDDRSVTAQINNFGLRGDDVPADAPRDELRVLGLGASRVFGSGEWDSHDVWDHALERLLAHELGGGDQPVRVLNGGVKGYSALQGARRAMRLIPELEPDLVLLFISAGAQMMLDPSSAQHWVTLESGEVVPRDIAEALPGPLRPLGLTVHETLLNSHLYLRYRAQFESAGSRPPTLLRFMYTGPEMDPAAREMFANTVNELGALLEFCQERGTELRAVVLPEAYQMNDQKWAEWLRYGATRDVGSPPQDTPRLAPTLALDARLTELGFSTWLMRDELEQMGGDVDTFTNDGRHWSKAGHRVIAVGLLERMRAEGLVQRLLAARRAAPRE